MFFFFDDHKQYFDIFKARNRRIYSIIEGTSLCKVSSLQLPWVSTHQHWHKLLRKVTLSRPMKPWWNHENPDYPCAVALSFIGAVICAGKSNSTTGTIGAARVCLLLWVFLSLALNQKLQNCFIIIQTISRIKKILSKTAESFWGLSQIVFWLPCERATSGKVLRVGGIVYPAVRQ